MNAVLVEGRVVPGDDRRVRLVDRGSGVRPFVRVDADHEHGVLQCCWLMGFGHGGYIGCVVDARETGPTPSPNATKHATSLHKIIYQGSLAP